MLFHTQMGEYNQPMEHGIEDGSGGKILPNKDAMIKKKINISPDYAYFFINICVSLGITSLHQSHMSVHSLSGARGRQAADYKARLSDSITCLITIYI